MTHTLVQDETAILQLFTDLEEGMRDRSPSRVVARYAEDAVTFTLAPPLRNTGLDARDPEAVAGWMAGFDGPITLEHRDLTVAVSGDVAFVHGLARMAAVPVGYPEGFSMWMRTTVGLRRREGGGWSRTSTTRRRSTWTDPSWRRPIWSHRSPAGTKGVP